MSKPNFEAWAETFDAADHEWMGYNASAHLQMIERLVREGATSEQIKSYAAQRVGSDRAQFVKRCEGAARHLRRVANA